MDMEVFQAPIFWNGQLSSAYNPQVENVLVHVSDDVVPVSIDRLFIGLLSHRSLTHKIEAANNK